MHSVHLHSPQVLCAFAAHTEQEIPESTQKVNGRAKSQLLVPSPYGRGHFRGSNSVSVTLRALEENTSSEKMSTLRG